VLRSASIMNSRDNGHPHNNPAAHAPHGSVAALSIAAAGIVYGDIGTSPLYALDQLFLSHGGVPLTQENVLGGISLVIWTITVIVAIKYAIFVLRAQNDGEGGRIIQKKNRHSSGCGPMVVAEYKVLAYAAGKLGYRDARVPNMAVNSQPYDGRPGCQQIGFCMSGCAIGAKWSTLYTEVPRAEATGNFELRAECHAIRIEHEGEPVQSSIRTPAA
jgi:hypothetical protein